MVVKFSERVAGIEISGIRKIFEAAGPGSRSPASGKSLKQPGRVLSTLASGSRTSIPRSTSRMQRLRRYRKERPGTPPTTGYRNFVPLSAGNSNGRTGSNITRTS